MGVGEALSPLSLSPATQTHIPGSLLRQCLDPEGSGFQQLCHTIIARQGSLQSPQSGLPRQPPWVHTPPEAMAAALTIITGLWASRVPSSSTPTGTGSDPYLGVTHSHTGSFFNTMAPLGSRILGHPGWFNTLRAHTTGNLLLLSLATLTPRCAGPLAARIYHMALSSSWARRSTLLHRLSNGQLVAHSGVSQPGIGTHQSEYLLASKAGDGSVSPLFLLCTGLHIASLNIHSKSVCASQRMPGGMQADPEGRATHTHPAPPDWITQPTTTSRGHRSGVLCG